VGSYAGSTGAGHVVFATKEPAHLLRGVTVIDAKPRARLLLARATYGQCWRGFFSSLKTERTTPKLYQTRDEAKAGVFD
jgi:hypothetical protein